MKVHTATRAGGYANADRVFVTDHAVIVLDGATAFEPIEVEPGAYADTLGSFVAEQLDCRPNVDLAATAAAAINSTVEKLRLAPGRSPSSTLSILRLRDDVVDMYVLGDSPVYYGQAPAIQRLTDDRLAKIATEERERYIARLRAGNGYDDAHKAAMAALQHAQHYSRNIDGGYWIAESEPGAATHGLLVTMQRSEISWAVLATDGGANFIDFSSNCPDWSLIAQFDSDQLAGILASIHEWESSSDPDGVILPRAKRHDDKTLAAVSEI
jgi:hypothetical protein